MRNGLNYDAIFVKKLSVFQIKKNCLKTLPT